MFVCENNLYGEFTPMQQVTGGRGHRRPRATPTGCRPRSSTATTCGRSPTRRAARPSTGRARGGGPTLLEAQTYRHYGHSKSDPATYRPKEEVERWMERDPLKLARARLLELGVDEDEIAQTESDVRAGLDRAVEAALAAPYPDPVEDGATEYAT